MPRPQSAPAGVCQHHGFALVESLLCLGLLAFALAGLVGAQVEALRLGQTAWLDTQAQWLLNDMLERLHANPAGGDYTLRFGEAVPALPVDCEQLSCSSQQLAIYDLRQWRARVDDGRVLPGAEGQILRTGSAEWEVSLRFHWRGAGWSAEDTVTRTLTVRTRP